MLNSRQKSNTFYEKKASHGIQTATLKTVALEKDKLDNNVLIFIFDTETGIFEWKIRKPYKIQNFFDLEVTSSYKETPDTRYVETCDKLVDNLYSFIHSIFEGTLADEATFFSKYVLFIDNLKSGSIQVTENNYQEFGFKRINKKVQKYSERLQKNYDRYEPRVMGQEPNTWAEDTGLPKYSYFEAIGNKVGDYDSDDFWNSFFEFVFEHAKTLDRTIEFIVKLTRNKSPEFEKDADGKVLKIDNKAVIKTIYYPVSVPTTRWFAHLGEDLKFTKAEQDMINEYLSVREALKQSPNVELKSNSNDDFNTTDLPF